MKIELLTDDQVAEIHGDYDPEQIPAWIDELEPEKRAQFFYTDEETGEEKSRFSSLWHVKYNGEMTQEEIDEANKINADSLKYAYRTNRMGAYPDIGDQLDDLFKAGVFSPEMMEKINAVKEAFPKPPEVQAEQDAANP